MESQVNLVDLVLMPLIAFIVGMLMVLLMRKIAARLQRRIGPPFVQPLYDIVKLHGKQTQISHGLIHEIGIETVWAHTALLAKATRAAAEALGMKPFSRQPSDSVTAIYYPDGVGDDFRKALQAKYGCSVAGGQEDVKGKIFRVSHMGYVDPLDTIGLIAAIEYTLADMGVDVKLGAGVTAAVKVLKDWK